MQDIKSSLLEHLVIVQDEDIGVYRLPGLSHVSRDETTSGYTLSE